MPDTHNPPPIPPTTTLSSLHSLLRLPLLHHLRDRPLERILPPKPQIRSKIHNRIIEHNKRTENPEISPPITVVNTESASKLIPIRILAELAYPICANLYVPARLRDEGLRVGLTRLTRWSVESCELVRIAYDGLIVDRDAEERFEEVVEGGEPVHPAAPEVWQVRRRHDDAAEGDDKEEEEWDQQGRQQLVWRE